MKIIVVDDEEVMRDSLWGYLTVKGHQCQVAKSGEAALALIEKDEADVVITDFNMPNMNGVDLLKILRNKHPKVKVVLLTGFADVENAIDAVNLGAYGFYRKSKDIFKFTKMINQIEKESLAG